MRLHDLHRQRREVVPCRPQKTAECLLIFLEKLGGLRMRGAHFHGKGSSRHAHFYVDQSKLSGVKLDCEIAHR